MICLPPIKEQQKISLILSSVDEKIENTDKLIEKTKELKKGLMQRLLTKGIGHDRFKDTEIGRIPEEWDIKINRSRKREYSMDSTIESKPRCFYSNDKDSDYYT